MNTRSIFTAALGLALAFFASSSFADTLVSVDPKAKVINVDTGGGLKAYRLQDPVVVRVNGVTVPIDQLQAGMEVTLGFVGGQTVASITAVAAKAPLGASDLIESPNAARHITLKMKVDAKDLVKVKDGKLWIEHKSFSKPTDISVNGRNWKVVWNGNKSDEFINFVPPLAPFGGTPVEVKKVIGRGSVTLKQTPTTENGGTLVVEFDDSVEPGAAEYEARITW